MSVLGIDFGNESCAVAVARKCGIDMVPNEESKYETPSIVCFGDRQRFIGAAGAVSSSMNLENSVSQIKRLIGRRFSDPVLQNDIKSFPFSVIEGPNDCPLILAKYLGKECKFTPTHIFAMVLLNLKNQAEKNLKTKVSDCCIGIPSYFTDIQRRAILDAAEIARLNPLRLIHELTAVALAYGIYRTDLPENGQFNVAFVDIGHASMQVCIAGYSKGCVMVLGHASDQSLGGRDFDDILLQYFSTKFKREYEIDVSQNVRARTRLMTVCQKLKKVLSANPVGHINIECLMDDKDVDAILTREEFEHLSKSILEKVKYPLKKALKVAGLEMKSINVVEVVGSGSRIPAIIKTLTEVIGREPQRTLNANECVARGCALQCAILSPTFVVREFQIRERFPFTVAFEDTTSDSKNNTEKISRVIFQSGSSFPDIRILSAFKVSQISGNVVYTNEDGRAISAALTTWKIKPPMDPINDDLKELRIKFEINIHGILSIKTATLLIEKKVLRTQAVGNKKSYTLQEHISMEDEESTENSGVSNYGAMNSSVFCDDQPAMKMENDAKVIVVKEDALIYVHVHGGMTADELRETVEKEREMTKNDNIMEETKDKKNALEAYVYNTREKIESKYRDYATDEEKRSLLSSLQEVEDWLYGEGEDVTKDVYADKLEWLKQQGDPIEQRYSEDMQRNTAIKSVTDLVKKYWAVAFSNDPKFDHINIAEREKIKDRCVKVNTWLCEKKVHQGALPKNVNPVLRCADLKKMSELLERFCNQIVEEPRAPPNKPAPPPKAQTSRNDQRQQEKQLQQEQRQQYQKQEEEENEKQDRYQQAQKQQQKQDRYQQAQKQQQKQQQQQYVHIDEEQQLLKNEMQQKPSDTVEQVRTIDSSHQERSSGSKESNNVEDPTNIVPSHLTNNSTEESTSVHTLPATK